MCDKGTAGIYDYDHDRWETVFTENEGYIYEEVSTQSGGQNDFMGTIVLNGSEIEQHYGGPDDLSDWITVYAEIETGGQSVTWDFQDIEYRRVKEEYYLEKEMYL